MTARTIITLFSTGAIAALLINVVWTAIVAAPISWLWSRVVAPLTKLPAISYGQALGMLLLWLLLRLTMVGIQLSAKLRDSD